MECRNEDSCGGPRSFQLLRSSVATSVVSQCSSPFQRSIYPVALSTVRMNYVLVVSNLERENVHVLKREEWLPLARKLDWEYSYVQEEDVFPKVISGTP